MVFFHISANGGNSDFSSGKKRIFDTKTKKLIFTHMGLHNVVKIESVIDDFPFDVSIANDGDCFEV